MVGGLGICGRPFCCSSFLEDFQPVSIKMAKTQNLSLNPTKISGTCGRLMCCLKYEQEAYEDLLRRSPKQESFVDTPEGRGTVTEVDLLRQRVKVRMEDSPETISQFANEEIAILRNGKAKKNDPPIPADLAPISGNGKRKHQEPQEEEKLILEPIKFRYSTETIADEEEVQAEPEKKPRRRRKPQEGPRKNEDNRKPREPRDNKGAERREPQKPAGQKAPRPEGQKPEQEDGEKKPRRRTGHYRRRRPRSGEGKAPEKSE